MLRIGIVTATYLPSKNGVAISTHLLVEGLRALGHEIRLFAPHYPNAKATPGAQGFYQRFASTLRTAA